MSHLGLIFVGCGFGGVFRYLLSSYAYQLLGKHFPFGTLIVNVVGSFLIGILFIILLERFGNWDLHLRNLLLVGFLGGFTTFSSFSLESLNLIESGKIWIALLYIFSSVILCLLAVWLGSFLVKEA